MKFYLLNVFTHEGLAGNQLAVVFPKDELPAERMQAIAKEFNFSETVFIYDPINSPSLRIFTPRSELFFAGHPTVGGAWLLRRLNFQESHFNLKVPLGSIEATVNDDECMITFPGKAEIKEFSGDLNDLFLHSNVNESDAILDQIRNVSVGPEFTVIPLKSRQALSLARSPLQSLQKVKAYFVFRENKNKFYVRMFAPVLSVSEDAATGAAACALAAYLEQFLRETSGEVVISQGVEMQRECELHLKWDQGRIQVGGDVKIWAEGNLI